MSNKINPDKLDKFLLALNSVKQDHTCGYCKQICVKPVVLSVCFHLICAEHFENLNVCPTCNISLQDCKTFADEQLEKCVEATKTLDTIFKDRKIFDFESQISQSGKDSFVERNKFNKENDSLYQKSDSIPTKVSKDKDSLYQKSEKVVTKSKVSDGIHQKSVSVPAKMSNVSDSLYKKSENVSKKINKEMDSDHKVDIFSKKSPKTDTSFVSNKVDRSIEKKNSKGESMLHVACRLGKVDKVVELLNLGANTNTKDNAGWTPLHEVVQNGRLDLVKLLLQYNTLINVPGPSNETPLHEAVRYGHSAIAEELVRNGADIEAKNCKGETPLHLASSEMKEALLNAAEDLQQTQGFNITHIANIHSELDYEDIRVYCTSQFRTVSNKLKALTKVHPNLHVESKFTKKVTHLIVDVEEDGSCVSSLDLLQGIVYGIWILSSNWVTESSEEELEKFEAFEVNKIGIHLCNGPKNARYNKYKQLPGLFNGCHFYLHNFIGEYQISKSLVLTKPILSKLITDAGGVVLRRVPNPESIPDSEKLIPYHAKKGGKLENCSHYIIFKDDYQPRYNMAHIKALSLAWLIDCIERYELCDP